jgi:hypothetical protein
MQRHSDSVSPLGSGAPPRFDHLSPLFFFVFFFGAVLRYIVLGRRLAATPL